MGKRLFLAFLMLISASTGFVIAYVQSAHFAQLLRNRFATEIESQLGIILDFDRLSIQAIPPGIAIINPEIRRIKPQNALGLPVESVIKAAEVGLTFRMLQTFGKRLVVNRFFFKGAEIRLPVYGRKGGKAAVDRELVKFLSRPVQFRLENGVELDLRQLELRDCAITLLLTPGENPDMISIGRIRYFALRPERSLYSSVLDLENLGIRISGRAEQFSSLKANLEIDPNLVRIISFDLTRPDGTIHLGGKLSGDVSNPAKLKNELRLIGRASSAAISNVLGLPEDLNGTWSLELLVGGTPDEPNFQGTADVQGFAYKSWVFDRFTAKLEGKRERIKLINADLIKGASKFSLSNFEIRPANLAGDYSVDFRMDKVRFADLIGEFRSSVNNLEFNASGDGRANFQLMRLKSGKISLSDLSLTTDLGISAFELNNQAYGKVREKIKILDVESFRLLAQTSYKEGNLLFTGSKLILPTGEIDVEGGVRSGVWGLSGRSSEVDIGNDLRTIANNPIKGSGTVNVGVRGSVDDLFLAFDVNLRNASYVNLDLGEVKGTITLDDRESKLILKNMKGRTASGLYEVDGIVDIGGDDSINLKMKLSGFNPKDLFGIFKHQLRNTGWIPWDMTGKINGRASLGGKFTDPERTFDLRGEIRGEKLVYRGELLNTLQAGLSLSKGVYSLEDVDAKKHNSRITGSLSYSVDDILDYKFKVERGRLRDSDNFSRLGIPMDGTVQMSGWGKGKPDVLQSHFELRVDNGHIGASNLPPIYARLDSNAERIEAVTFLGDQQSRARIRLTRDDRKPSEIDIITGGSDYAFILCFINSSFCGERPSSIIYESRFQAQWPARNWERMNGSLVIDKLKVSTDTYSIQLPKTVNLAVRNGQLSATDLKFSGPETDLSFSASGQVSGENYEGKLSGSLNLQALELITSVVRRAGGNINLDTQFKGSVSDLRLNGRAEVSAGMLQVKGLTPAIEELNGRLQLSGNRMRIERLEGKWGQGRAWFDGFVELFLNRPPVFSLGLNLQDNRIGFEPLSFAELDRGRITFAGESPPYLLSGRVKFRRAVIRQNFESKKKSQIRTAKYLPTELDSTYGLYKVRIEAFADSGLLVQNDDMDSEFKGSLVLMNNFDFPRIVGDAELIKGRIFFRNIPFDLDHAIIKQANEEELNPWFSLGGGASIGSYRVNVFANGYANDPKITLGSSPPLPQEDILSLIAFGYIERSDATIRSDDRSAVTYTEAGSILLDQLRINKDLKSRGFNVRVGPTVIQKEANIIRPRDVPESAVPKILVQTQVTRNVDATLGTTVGGNQSQQFDVNVEYRLNERMSVQSVYEQEPGTDAGEAPRSSFGGDLKFKWGFK